LNTVFTKVLKDEEGENRISIPTPILFCPLEDTPASENQGHNKQNQENHEHNLGNAGSSTRNAGEPKYRSDNGNDEQESS
jgi:hypothetical protein